MKAALAVPQLSAEVHENLQKIREFVLQAASHGADLILFPEAVLTGLVNCDDPAHDLLLGIEIPGPLTHEWAKLSKQTGLIMGLGVLEREGQALYDAALLITPDQGIVLHYRRITPGWHGPKADPHVYRQGTHIHTAHTHWGTFAFLICGDLFDDRLVTEIREKKPDFLLVPMARAFPEGSWDPKQWDQEKPFYIQQAKKAGAMTLITNYLADESLGEDRSFGGAMSVLPDGTLFAEYPIGQEGMLVVSLEKPWREEKP